MDRRADIKAREVFQTAQHLFAEGKHLESIDLFSRFMAIRGEVEIALLSRGVAYLKTDQIDKAVKDFGKVIEINNQNVRAYFYRGIASMSAGDFQNAIEDFDRTIELKPDHGTAFIARGSAYAQSGNDYEAARNIRTAITLLKGNMQGVTDTYGLFRTQFDRAMTVMSDKAKSPGTDLTEEEIQTVKKWLNERDQ